MKMNRRELDSIVADLAAIIQSNWHAVRHVASKLYAAKGRGAILVDIGAARDIEKWLNEGLVYLSHSLAREHQDEDLRNLLSGGIDWYNPAREIAFLVQAPDESLRTLILGEFSDGTPRLTEEETDRRWAGQERSCPKCEHRFIGLKDNTSCPKCGTLFRASDMDHTAKGPPEAEPIGRFVDPSGPPRSFEEVHDRIREHIIREGQKGIEPNERLVWLICHMDQVVRHEGFEGYLGSCPGDEIIELQERLQSCQILGALKEIFGQVYAMRFAPEPSVDTPKWSSKLTLLDEPKQRRLDNLTQAYLRKYSSSHDIEDRLMDLFGEGKTAPDSLYHRFHSKGPTLTIGANRDAGRLYLLRTVDQITAMGPWKDDFLPYPWKQSPAAIDHAYFGVPRNRNDRRVDSAAELQHVISAMGDTILVSETTWGVLAGLALEPELRAMPATIVNRKRERLADYKYLWTPKKHAIVDRSRAEVEYFESSPGVIKSVSQWAINDDQVPPFDLFESELFCWIVTARLKQAFEEAGITGVQFEPIDDVGSLTKP